MCYTVHMKKLTLWLEDETIYDIKKMALDRQLSASKLVRELIEKEKQVVKEQK